MAGHYSKKKLNKIIIYQLPLFEKIVYLTSALGLTSISIFCLFIDIRIVLKIFLLLAMFSYNVGIFYLVFKTYICLDLLNKKIIIRECPGFRKEEISLIGIINFSVLYDEKAKHYYLNIRYSYFEKKIDSWFIMREAMLVLFPNIRQSKRLKKFADECNEYLLNYIKWENVDGSSRKVYVSVVY